MNKEFTQNSLKTYRFVFDSAESGNAFSQKSSMGGKSKGRNQEQSESEFKKILKKKMNAA